jgi:hypothetical protein
MMPDYHQQQATNAIQADPASCDPSRLRKSGQEPNKHKFEESTFSENRPHTASLPNDIDIRTVQVGGVLYSIVGVTHDPASSASRKYNDHVRSLLQGDEIRLYEQGLKVFFPSRRGLEIADYAVNSFSSTMKLGVWLGLCLPFIGLNLAYRCFTGPDLRQKSETDRRKSFHPTGNRLTHSERRSAYQSEFMKAYKSGQPKLFLVGKNHIPQICFFLTHGVDDEKIVRMARLHARYAEHHPTRFRLVYTMSLFGEVFALCCGTALGLTPYYAALLSKFFLSL